MPQTLTIDDVLVVLTYCVVSDERVLDLELRYADGTYSLGTYSAFAGLVLAAAALSAGQRATLTQGCAEALQAWNDS